MIQVDQLYKSYAGTETLHGISFTINKGEIVGFLGPNGAGKTTTMRILTGYLPPTAGKVKIAGYDIVEDSIHARRHIGYLPELVPLYTDLTVTEYITFFARIMKIPKVSLKREVQEVMDKTGLTGVSRKLIGSLSRGYRQRVGLAQALIGKPEVLILDEPTVGLDPVQIIEIRELIKTLAKNQTVILSTHILPEVSQICDRVLIINKGSIVADSNVRDLTATDKTRNVVKFVVGGNGQKALSLIQNFQGVSSSDLKTADGESILTVESVRDIRQPLLKDLIAQGVDVLEFTGEKVDLESVFLKLVTEEKGAK
ncbi:MAG: ABC transporter ATP-binding protein [bacterium]|nr:ABC transporter ATP-binding protein [bacterium]